MLRWNRSGKYCSIVDADLGLEVRPDHMYMRWIMILRVESDLECPEVFDRWHRIARHKYTANKAEFQYKNGNLRRFSAPSGLMWEGSCVLCRYASNGTIFTEIDEPDLDGYLDGVTAAPGKGAADPMTRSHFTDANEEAAFMIHVLAVITANPGQRDRVLEAFHANVPAVRAEEGCIEYVAAVDAEDFGGFQTKFGPDTFVVIEKWASAGALKAHAAAPHMAAYAAKTKSMLASRVIRVLSPA
jgi:quinol monooxygenase YgiN